MIHDLDVFKTQIAHAAFSTAFILASYIPDSMIRTMIAFAIFQVGYFWLIWIFKYYDKDKHVSKNSDRSNSEKSSHRFIN